MATAASQPATPPSVAEASSALLGAEAAPEADLHPFDVRRRLVRDTSLVLIVGSLLALLAVGLVGQPQPDQGQVLGASQGSSTAPFASAESTEASLPSPSTSQP